MTSPASPDDEVTIPLPGPLDLRVSFGPLAYGRTPTVHCPAPGELWRATRTPAGPATVRIVAATGSARVQAWGPGSAWLLERAADLCGVQDDPAGWDPPHPLIRELHKRHRGLRHLRVHAVLETLLPVILEQKVTTIQARRSWNALVRSIGAPAPGPVPLLLPPDPAVLGRLGYAGLHRFEIERKRAETLILAARHAARLEEATDMPPDQAIARLEAIPGIGPWSSASVASRALGHTDAVITGDYHLPHDIAWALAREHRGTDARMLDLLEPFRPQRGRVQRLLEIGRIHAPSRGPRTAPAWLDDAPRRPTGRR